jgi:N-formylglutamate amidohydrolase
MSDVYTFHAGKSPLLITVPHDGLMLAPGMVERMTPEGRALPDTDWHVAQLYDFARELGASVLVAKFSRYVVDLNRPASDEALYPGQLATGLCPEQTFAGDAIYECGGVDAAEQAARSATYWRPYHERISATLDALRERFGYALLWDAHSIPSQVPRLFEGELPALNIGTFGGRSCAVALEEAVAAVAAASPYSHVVNGRFQGGFITREYGRPVEHVHAVQLEIAQRVYMDELATTFDARKASQLRDTLRLTLESFIEAAQRDYV